MRKNINKIISTILVTISIFTLVGCGQSDEQSKEELKEELKEEIKQEIKADEEQAKADEVKDVTKESLTEFQKAYNAYNEKMNKSLGFMLTDDNPNKITVEQGLEVKKETEKIKETVLKTTPKIIEDEVKDYLDLYEQLFDSFTKTLKFGDEENTIISKKNDVGSAIVKKVAELKTQLDNKTTK